MTTPIENVGHQLIWTRVSGGGCVYALAFSNGTVKVGKTSHLNSRFSSHISKMAGQHGARPVDWYFTRTHADYSATEQLAIAAAVSVMTAESSRTGREWFHHIDFGQLTRLLLELDPTGSYPGERAAIAG